MKKVQTHLFSGIFTYIILTLFRGIFLTRWHRRELALLLFLTLDLKNVLWPSLNHQDCPYFTQLPYGLFRTPWTCPDVISVNKDGTREAQPNVPSKTQVAGVERCHTWNNPFMLSLWLLLKHPFLQCRTENPPNGVRNTCILHYEHPPFVLQWFRPVVLAASWVC